MNFPTNPHPQPIVARSTLPIDAGTIDRDVVLSFIDGDLMRPLIMGVLEGTGRRPGDEVSAEADGKRMVLSAEHEITLKCGEASITLTRAGKVIIRGAYVLSRSSGVNRIKGGSVQIN